MPPLCCIWTQNFFSIYCNLSCNEVVYPTKALCYESNNHNNRPCCHYG